VGYTEGPQILNFEKERSVFFFFPQFSNVALKVEWLHEDLAKSGYKTNRKVENLRISLHVGEPLEPIS
jgi:hypothetical protein